MKHKKTPDQTLRKIIRPELVLDMNVPHITAELAHALNLMGLAHNINAKHNSQWSAVLTGISASKKAIAPETESPSSQEGFFIKSYGDTNKYITAKTAHGLANGLYELRRFLLAKSYSKEVSLPDGIHEPDFSQRDCYHFLSPWKLKRLTCDAFDMAEWKIHLDRIRSLNVNRLYFDIWASQYYHPDDPSTSCNIELYARLRSVLKYAHELGMRTGVYLFPAQVPVDFYLSNPGFRAKEAVNYHGINACPARGWREIIRYDTFLIDYFGADLDDIVVEIQDPGSCLCPECCRQMPEQILRFIETYRSVSGGPADRQVDICTLHFRDWLEDPGKSDTGVAFPIEGLRKKVFSKLPEGTTIIDIDDPTLIMGQEAGFKANYFFFDLDPESGIENQQVFPRVKLHRIKTQVEESLKRKHSGITAYRMMPFAQHVADYVLFRKCWEKDISVDRALSELAAEYGLGPEHVGAFINAMSAVDAWWEESRVDGLGKAVTDLEKFVDSESCQWLIDLRDQIAVLRILALYLVENRECVKAADFYPPEDLVDRVRSRMIESTIFEAYTVFQHWVLRSQEIIGQRIRWWLKGMDAELKTRDPARQAGN